MYALVEDIQKRCSRTLSDAEKSLCETLLEDAEAIIDSYHSEASTDIKKVVSCNMILRAIASSEQAAVPIGATQGSISALGYSQSWTLSGGSTGELYMTKTDKRLLGVLGKVSYVSQWDEVEE